MIACLDLEGVLLPEIWIKFAEKTGVEDLKLTTRDIPDYDELMTKRLKILKENNFKFGKDKSKIPTKGMCNQKKFACFVIEVLLSFIIFCHHKKLLTFRVSTCQVCKIRLFIFCSMPFHSRKPKKNKWREEKEKSHLASPHLL